MHKIQWRLNRREIKRNIRNHRLITWILILQCTACFTLIALLAGNLFYVNSGVDRFKKYVGDKSYYSLHDRADQNGVIDKYCSYDTEYYKFAAFVNELRHRTDLTLISTVIQPIFTIGITIPDKFGHGYEDGYYEPYEKDGQNVCPVKCMQVSENVFSEFGLTVSEGRSFSGQDFILTEGNYSRAIMGSQYKDYYQIGDHFSAIYLGEVVDFEVVGFLPPDSYVPVHGWLEYLDRYILTPAFTQIDGEERSKMARMALLQQANGEITTTDQHLDVPALVNELSAKYSTIDFNVYKIGETEIIRTIRLSDEIVQRLLLITMVLIVFTVICVSINIRGRIREDYYRYGVHLMSGASLSDISHQLTGVIVHIIGWSLLFSLAFALVFTGFGWQLAIVVLVALTVLLLSCVTPVMTINRLDINYLIRRKE